MLEKTGEIWKAVAGFPCYDVSDQGRVRSYMKKAGNGRWVTAKEPQKVLKPSVNKRNGYLGVGLRSNGESHYLRVASLVMLTFVGERPEGQEICHNNGDSADNRLVNLRYDTRSANMQESRQAVLDSAKVIDIRRKRAMGATILELAEEYGSAASNISSVCRGKTWCNVGGPIITTGNHITDTVFTRVPIEVKKIIRREAEERGINMSTLVRQLIRRGLELD